jgi:putative hydrolase of the HAD superfamily
VTVDFWGTLIMDSPGADERYEGRRLSGFAAILREGGVAFSAAQLSHAYARSGELIRQAWSTGRDVPVVEPVKEILRALDAELPQRTTPAQLLALVDAYSRPILQVPPTVDRGARAALVHLRDAGIALAIVSNTMRTPGATLRELLQQFRLLECFDHLVFSDEIGVRKPRPEIFENALRAVGGEPATAVHVGDDPVLDVHGARAAGLKTIQVVGSDSDEAPASERPDRTITQLSELPAAIAALEAG